MTPSKQIINAIKGTIKAFSLIPKLKLKWIYILPFGIYILIYGFGLSLTDKFHDLTMKYVEDSMTIWTEKYALFEYLMGFSSFLTWIVIKLSLFILLGIISGYVALIILSPVYAWISEKMEEEISNVKYPFKLSKFLKDVSRAILIALRNGFIQLTWTIILFFLSFIPGVNLITAPLLFLITAYFYGFSFLDYSHERLGVSMRESIKRVRSMKFSAITLGSIFLICFMIPWIGAFIASTISFHLVLSGTNLVLQIENET